MKKSVLPVVLAGLWITLSEFVRNEFILKHYWAAHFNALGLKFETLALNGMLWMVWSFVLAFMIFRLSRKFSMAETLFLCWLPSFVMMWIVIFNLQVLPMAILWFAVPLSVLEIVVAQIIIKRTVK